MDQQFMMFPDYDEQDDNKEQIGGRAASVIFTNEDNGYTVLRLEGPEGHFTAVGCIPFPAPGEDYLLTGTWIQHPEYGRQFQVESFERWLPSDQDGMIVFLGSGLLRGIGTVTATRIVEEFGPESYGILRDHPEKLSALRGITEARAKEASADFVRQLELRQLIEFTAQCGLPVETALRLHMRLGPLALSVVSDNPYILVDDYYGIDFAVVDRFAMELGFTADASLRLEAAIRYELLFNSRSGHVFVPREKLCMISCQLLEQSDTAAMQAALDNLINCGEVICENICREDACYLASLYEAESECASRLIRARRAGKQYRRNDAEPLILDAERKLSIEYAHAQREAMFCAAENGVMVLTGGPGTGKTTTIRGILLLFEQMGLSVTLTAPTGRAAKRITQLCGAEAKTIHRLLEAGRTPDNTAAVFGRNAENPLDTDAIIVDELSMVDLPLMHALLCALRPDTRIVLVGDADQLPSVGPGNLLRDLIASGVVPAIHLDEIFRQAQESAIVTGAHAVNNGCMPTLTGTKDLFFMRRNRPEDTVSTVVELCKTRLPNYYHLDPAQIQVITPTRQRETGCVSLNQSLQAALNPPARSKAEFRRGDLLLRVGDRVMQTVNNYDLLWQKEDASEAGMGVFNGDIGVITEIDTKAELINVRFDDRMVTYAAEQAHDLELAYAVTVHKSQGSEFPCVVFVAYDGAKRLLSRNLLYTGMTRARDLLVMVGRPETLSYMIDNNVPQKRYTALRVRLRREATKAEE